MSKKRRSPEQIIKSEQVALQKELVTKCLEEAKKEDFESAITSIKVLFGSPTYKEILLETSNVLLSALILYLSIRYKGFSDELKLLAHAGKAGIVKDIRQNLKKSTV